jgi:hypothetical protein
MNLPTMPADLVSREYLRIGGGYGAAAAGSSPAGGLDIDNAGNAAADGDLTVDGGFSAGGGLLAAEPASGRVTAQDFTVEDDFDITGRDLTWSLSLHAADGFPASSNGCSGPAQTQVRIREVEYRSLDFAAGADRRAVFNFVLPPHYPGGALRVDLFWTFSSGTAGGDVRWVVNALNLDDGDAMDQNINPGIGHVLDTAIAAHDMHRAVTTLTPVNAAGHFCNLLIIRNGANAADDFDGTARLAAVRLTNA